MLTEGTTCLMRGNLFGLRKRKEDRLNTGETNKTDFLFSFRLSPGCSNSDTEEIVEFQYIAICFIELNQVPRV